MNGRMILWIVGVVVAAVGAGQIPCLVLALLNGEPALPFAIASVGATAIVIAIWRAARLERESLDHRSAIAAVAIGWWAASAVGGLPFAIHPALQASPADALFEAVSGFTTTGATIFANVDGLPRSILLWRSLTHWLGGMGIVLLGIAVLPVLGLGGMQLFKAESPGPTKSKMTPRVAETARVLWTLYVGLTAVDALALFIAGMTPFDAICHSMATLATGGFSTHDASMAHYDSPAINNITTLFMFLSGMSFVVLHRALTGEIPWKTSPQLRTYVGIFLAAGALITLDLYTAPGAGHETIGAASEHAFFQAASLLTTTGFSSEDYDIWPPVAHAVLLAVCFVGGMAGSTAGGVKVVRVVVLAKVATAQLFLLIHPRGYRRIKLGDKVIEDETLFGVLGFVSMWGLLILGGGLGLAACGAKLGTSFSATIATLGNIGPGFAEVGPTYTYAAFSGPAKLLMSGLMILGRLEVFTVLVVLTPAFWRR